MTRYGTELKTNYGGKWHLVKYVGNYSNFIKTYNFSEAYSVE